jgi:hypothetical protein
MHILVYVHISTQRMLGNASFIMINEIRSSLYGIIETRLGRCLCVTSSLRNEIMYITTTICSPEEVILSHCL